MLDIQLVLSILLSQILEIELCLVLHGSAEQEFEKNNHGYKSGAWDIFTSRNLSSTNWYDIRARVDAE